MRSGSECRKNWPEANSLLVEDVAGARQVGRDAGGIVGDADVEEELIRLPETLDDQTELVDHRIAGRQKRGDVLVRFEQRRAIDAQPREGEDRRKEPAPLAGEHTEEPLEEIAQENHPAFSAPGQAAATTQRHGTPADLHRGAVRVNDRSVGESVAATRRPTGDRTEPRLGPGSRDACSGSLMDGRATR